MIAYIEILELYSRHLTSSKTVGQEWIGKTRDVCLFDLGYSFAPAHILPYRTVPYRAVPYRVVGNEKARDKIPYHHSQEDIVSIIETF